MPVFFVTSLNPAWSKVMSDGVPDSTCATSSLVNPQLEFGLTSLKASESIRVRSNSSRRPRCFQLQHRRWHARKYFGGDAPCGACISKERCIDDATLGGSCGAPVRTNCELSLIKPLCRVYRGLGLLHAASAQSMRAPMHPLINESVFPSCRRVNSPSPRHEQSSRWVHVTLRTGQAAICVKHSMDT
ncbi:hypothetical protein MTO96_022895 [Rhipicephalus appendiculatus]